MAAIVKQGSADEWHILATAQLEEEFSRMAFHRWQEHLCIRKAGDSKYEIAYCKQEGGRLVSTGKLRLLVTPEWFETLDLLREAPERIKAFIQSNNE